MLSRGVVYFVFSIAILFIFSACATSEATVSKQKPVPSWVYSPPPHDTQNYIYGIAIESDRELAIKSALSDMIAKLGVTIESSFESYQVVDGSYSNLTTKNQIKSAVSKIKINNYMIINAYKISYREFAVIVKTNRKKLAKSLETSLGREQKEIAQSYKALTTRDTITRYRVKKELSLKSQEMIPKILMLYELNKDFQTQGYMDFVAKKKSQFLQEQSSLKFFVHGDKKSLKFVDIVKDSLAKDDFVLGSSKKGAVEIILKTDDYISKNTTMDIIVINLNIATFDNSEQLGVRSIVLKERYNGLDLSAYKNASIHLRQDIDAMGIDELLGLKLN